MMSESMVRVGVLSDTHLPDSAEAFQFIETVIEEVLAPVDMILHAGDLVAPELLEAFSAYPFHAVRGNMDPPVAGVPIKKVVDVEGFIIGLIHGWGPAEKIEERIEEEFASLTLDCLVYGHSHEPACHWRDGVLFFNPGSATNKRNMPYHTVGLLEIGHDLRGEIIRLD